MLCYVCVGLVGGGCGKWNWKNDAQIDTLICWSPLKNKPTSKRSKTNKWKLFFGHRWAQGGFQSTKMEPNRPTWSQHDIKRTAMLVKMEPQTAKMEPKVTTVRQKAINKTKKRCSKKVGTRTSTRILGIRPGSPFFLNLSWNVRVWEPKSLPKLIKINAKTSTET